MILVDTSLWIDHLRRGNERLVALLRDGRVLVHPHVIGEIALGSLRQSDLVLLMLQDMPQAAVASADEVLHFIDRNRLYGLGIGLIDACLLAAVKLTPGSTLWTADKRLAEVAGRMGLAADPA